MGPVRIIASLLGREVLRLVPTGHRGAIVDTMLVCLPHNRWSKRAQNPADCCGGSGAMSINAMRQKFVTTS
jgi:hypothetical protein